MSVETVIQAMRNAVAIDKDGINHVADLLEQLQAENKRLKANQPVKCGECIHIFERHYEDEFEPPYIKYACKYKGNYQVFLNDFCSYGERVARVERD
ncbi:MAG: hypothetical protein PHU31_11710 [Anaerotignum sp.]|nr:hypothetical protein [Anaerotignum sp.]MDD4844970.1 hypothetical protein [Anaerotignum sp.]